jgi:hypothetical protein
MTVPHPSPIMNFLGGFPDRIALLPSIVFVRRLGLGRGAICLCVSVANERQPFDCWRLLPLTIGILFGFSGALWVSDEVKVWLWRRHGVRVTHTRT